MKHILVIDDEEPVRTLLRNYLESEGYSVCMARDGKQALQLFAKYHADLIITDVFMPEKDGLEVLAALRQNGATLPVIAISGGGRMQMDDVLRIARSLGATRVLDKPIALELLLETVQELLPPSPPEIKPSFPGRTLPSSPFDRRG